MKLSGIFDFCEEGTSIKYPALFVNFILRVVIFVSLDSFFVYSFNQLCELSIRDLYSLTSGSKSSLIIPQAVIILFASSLILESINLTISFNTCI